MLRSFGNAPIDESSSSEGFVQPVARDLENLYSPWWELIETHGAGFLITRKHD
jgi:hypothetical protein